MKRFAVLFAVSLAAGCARPAYVARSDADASYLKGAVARLSETHFTDYGDEFSLPDSLARYDTHTVVEYNRAGNVTRSKSVRGADSVQLSLEEYFYDSSGERLERAVSHDAARRGTTTVVHRYDERGLPVAELESNGFYRFDTKYDRHGYPRVRSTTDAETGRRIIVARYFYDRHGRQARISGEKHERYRYHPDGTIAEIRIKGGSKDIYDTEGNLVSTTVVVKNRNEKGRLLNRVPVTITARYEFDTQGNWTKRVQYHNAQALSVAVREIEYHDGGAE